MSGIVSYGVDINAYAGDLIDHNSLVPTRLNPSFGQIVYSDNNRSGNYEALIFNFRSRFARGFFNASYTRSSSKDDAGQYPTALNPSQYYGPSPWDVPNRFSLTFNYSLRGLNGGRGLVGHVTGGWGISGNSIYQTGISVHCRQHGVVPSTEKRQRPVYRLCSGQRRLQRGRGQLRLPGRFQLQAGDFPQRVSQRDFLPWTVHGSFHLRRGRQREVKSVPRA
jgi:hypothetical protein